MIAACAGSAGTSSQPGSGPVAPVPRDRMCAAPSDCVLRSRSCCGRCGAATLDDSVAVPRAELASFRCTDDNGGCPDCHEDPDPALFATCREGACVVMHASTLSTCTTDEDCELTYSGCCECGTPGYVSVGRGKSDEYRALVCDQIAACPACAQPPHPSEHAVCRENRCAVERR